MLLLLCVIESVDLRSLKWSINNQLSECRDLSTIQCNIIMNIITDWSLFSHSLLLDSISKFFLSSEMIGSDYFDYHHVDQDSLVIEYLVVHSSIYKYCSRYWFSFISIFDMLSEWVRLSICDVQKRNLAKISSAIFVQYLSNFVKKDMYR